MIASKDEYLEEASQAMFRMSADDLIRKRCRDREEYYQDLRNYERVIAEKERNIEETERKREQDLRNYERVIAEKERSIEENERKREQDRLEHEQDLRNYERVIAEKEQENEKLRAEIKRLKQT